MLKSITGFVADIFSPETPARTYAEEQERFARKVALTGGILCLFAFLPYIETDSLLYPDIKILFWLRLGLTFVSILGLFWFYLLRKKKYSAYYVTIFVSFYLLNATGIITGLTGGNPAYMGGYNFVLMCVVVLNLPFRWTFFLFQTSVTSFAISLYLSEKFNFSDRLFQYSLRDLMTVYITAQVFSYLFYRIRKKNSNHVQTLHEQNILIEQKNKNIESSLRYAQKIQKVILESSPEEVEKSDYFCLYLPKDIVSGDFYRIYHRTSEQRYFVLGDCTGHGVPGAFLTILAVNALDTVFSDKNDISPANVLQKFDTILQTSLASDSENVDDGIDSGIILLDKAAKTVCFSSAKISLFLCRKGEIQKFKGARFSLGIKKNNTEKTFLQEKIQLEKGDMLYICSDGYADQMNEKKKKFLLSEFTKLLNEISVLPLEEQKNILFEKNRRWRGNMTQTDDISVIGIKID